MKTVDKYQFNEQNFQCQDGIPTYIALHTVLKKKFVVKMITHGTDKENQNNNYLTRQCQILKKISLQNVYRCHKLLKSKNNFYAVFDLVEGKTLEQILSQEISFQCKASIFKQLVELLLELRSRDIVYINLSPTNIIVQEKFKVILRNFGFAQQFSCEETQKSISISKIHLNSYFAPEIAQGKVYNNSDLYAFGIIIGVLFYSEFKNSQATKQAFSLVLQKFGINIILSIDKVKKIAQQLVRKDSKQRADLKQLLVNKKAYLIALSPEKGVSSKSSSKSRLKLHEVQDKKQLGISKSTSIISIAEDKSRQKIQKFEKLLEVILKKRGLTILFLKMSQIVLKNNQSELSTGIVLSFLLVKKTTSAIAQLKKLLSKGFNQQYFIPEKLLVAFQKESSFKYFLEIVSRQMVLTQSKLHDMVRDVKASSTFAKDEYLQLQTKNQNINQSFFTKIVLDFLLQLNLICSDSYVSQYEKDQLYYIYIFSLLAEFKTLQQVYQCFFSQEVIQMQEQPFYQQLSQISKIKFVELIEINTSKLYSQASGSFDLSVKTTKTVQTMKTIKSIK